MRIVMALLVGLIACTDQDTIVSPAGKANQDDFSKLFETFKFSSLVPVSTGRLYCGDK